MNSRRITLIVAIVLAVTTGLLTLRYLSSVNQTAAVAVVESKPVVIASRDIPTRAKITPDMLTLVKRPANEIEPGAIADPHQVVGDVALIAIPMNSTVTDTKIGQPGAVGLTGRLRPGMRAVTIAVDAIKSVNGMIQPGDRVDVLSSVGKGSGDRPRTFAIIRGALVLALNNAIEPQPDQSPAPPGQPGNVPSTVTLGVTVDQADLLTVADLNTNLRLALRSPNEPLRAEPTDPLDFQDSTPVPHVVVPPPAPMPTPVAVAAAPKKERPSVTIVDGDKLIQGAR